MPNPILSSAVTTSSFVRTLRDAAGVDAEASGMDFAERLGLWFNVFDALQLQAAHQAIRGMEPAAAALAPGERQARARALQEDVQRARGALVHAISQDPLQEAPLPLPVKGRKARSDPAQEAWLPFAHRHGELRQQMAMMVEPLRDHVRQALARATPALRQLAALDEVMEQVLERREQALLPTATALLQRRFLALREAHRLARGADPEAGADAEAAAPAPAAWLADFTLEWRQALMAELDLRLEPVQGLVDALHNEWNA